MKGIDILIRRVRRDKVVGMSGEKALVTYIDSLLEERTSLKQTVLAMENGCYRCKHPKEAAALRAGKAERMQMNKMGCFYMGICIGTGLALMLHYFMPCARG